MRTKNTPPCHSELVSESINSRLWNSRRGIKVTRRWILGFSLVELMVVITILIVLGTIAFLGFSSYTENARDSVRVSDLAHITQGLEIHYADQGYFPMPSSASGITFSGGVVWYQGKIGDDVVSTLNGVGAKLSKKPVDPIYKQTEYTYSLLSNKREYQLGTAMESSSTIGMTRGLIEHSYAASTASLVAYAKGNYNGILAKSAAVNNTTYYLAIPSIILQDISSVWSRELTTASTQSGNLVLHSKSNIPSTYTANGFGPSTVTTTYDRMRYSDDLRPVAQGGSGIVAYALTGTLTTSGIVDMMSGAYLMYSNSNLKGMTAAASSTNAFLNNGNSSSNLVTTYENIFNQRLGVTTSNAGSSPSSSSAATISHSLLFNGSSSYLNKSLAVSNRTKWSFSFWMKRSKLALSTNQQRLLSAWTSNTNIAMLSFDGNQLSDSTADVLNYTDYQGGYIVDITWAPYLRDLSSWYHVLLSFDTSQSTASDRVRLYINGKLQTTIGSPSYPSQGWINWLMNSTNMHYLGTWPNMSYFYNWYISNVDFVDSGALDPTAFGQFDSTTGQWVAKTYTGEYGKNGFHLDFSSGATDQSLGADSAPITSTHTGANNWNVNGMTVSGNQMIDNPGNNFATWNSLDHYSSPTVLNGSLQAILATTDKIRGTMIITQPTYFEIKIDDSTTSSNPNDHLALGVYGSSALTTDTYYSGPQSWAFRSQATTSQRFWQNDTTTIANSSTLVDGDIVMVAVNPLVGKVWYGKNGTWWNSGDPTNGTNAVFSNIPAEVFPFAHSATSTYSSTITLNVGQTPFSFAPPTGFKALSTTNLPDPAIKNPKQHFDVLTYTGDGANGRHITGLNFQPDLVWEKGRSFVSWNALFDSIRGPNNVLSSNSAGGDNTGGASDLVSFDGSGFTVNETTNWHMNQNTSTYVAWNWRKSAISGFDILSYTGNSTAGRSLSVALGNQSPSFAIIKRRNATSDWGVYHKDIPAGRVLWLQSTVGINDGGTLDSSYNNQIQNTADTLVLWATQTVNNSAGSYVAYVWSEVPGFSKFGSYTGNGSTDGPFVYTGFKPRWVMIKASSAGSHWYIMDTSRSQYNQSLLSLRANVTDIEQSTNAQSPYIDFLSNGFKVTGSNEWNGLGTIYIYAAFAEAPLKYATAR